MPLLSPPTAKPAASVKTTVARSKPALWRAIICELVFICATAAMIILVEFVFALAHVGEEDFLKIDPLLGYTHMEKKRMTFRSEGFSEDTTNSLGYHDVDHPVSKPNGVKRIALLGD